MSEPTTEPTVQPTDGGNSGYTPPATQKDLDHIITERVQRERAKYGDYEDLKGKAAQLATIEQANLSEVEKTAQKIAAAETQVAQIPAKVADSLRTHLIALHEINAEDAELFLTATDPELLLKQVQRLTGRESDRKKHGAYVPREGATTTTVEGEAVETVRELFAG
ncbi:MAG TPA: hypothetical protein VFE45_07290 [Coriobacteriia bacterium]|nr:hypothetical protein [Coriobacteriia bacterium]